MTTAQQHGVIPPLEQPMRLELARRYAGHTQREFAHILGVGPATIQRAETGVTKPRRAVVMAWAMATGVDLAWLECAIRDSNPEPADKGRARHLAAVA